MARANYAITVTRRTIVHVRANSPDEAQEYAIGLSRQRPGDPIETTIGPARDDDRMDAVSCPDCGEQLNDTTEDEHDRPSYCDTCDREVAEDA